MKRLVACLALALIAAAAPPPSAPNWMAGAWQETDGPTWNDEFWSPMRGGVMLGAARIGKGDAIVMWEQTRILRNADGSLTFWASPNGKPASAFPMVNSGPQMIEFANPAHDYPQRIRYWREGKLLHAEISLTDGSKAHRWRYRPMGG